VIRNVGSLTTQRSNFQLPFPLWGKSRGILIGDGANWIASVGQTPETHRSAVQPLRAVSGSGESRGVGTLEVTVALLLRSTSIDLVCSSAISD